LIVQELSIHSLIASYRPCQSDKLDIEDIERFELFVEYGSAFKAEPSLQHGSVDPAEVGMEFRSTIIQIGEAWARTYKPPF